MGRSSDALALAVVSIDRSATVAIHRQIYDCVREAILTRRLKAGACLPSTRALAEELQVSRNTVITAFEQLLAEGYIEGRGGSGTFVAHALPDDLLRVREERNVYARASHKDSFLRSAQGVFKGRSLSERGALLARTQSSSSRDESKVRAFQPGLPAIDEFPFETWGRILSKRWRRLPRARLGFGDQAGYLPLREAVADYLGSARGVRCEPEQVIIVSGSQEGLDLSARVLLDPGDAAWIEDPGYLGARGALLGAGAQLVPVPVDEHGLDVAAGEALSHKAKVAYVSPSHQYPLGVVMSLSRRLELLEWASRSGAWILEDDYDSEYRYAGRPLAALQGLDSEGRVIYVGTFSKVLFPSLRLGYLVVPPDLVDAFITARSHTVSHPPSLEQAALTDFIFEGHFARHIRRMRALYQERQAMLVEATKRELKGLLDVREAEAGMHLVGRLAKGVNDLKASAKAQAHNVTAPPLSFYSIEAVGRGGLLLGYTGVSTKEIRSGVRRLAAALGA
ncbi:MAG: PLP-dependent aminotransferase family protein [Blastocatellia bacterium]|nr:PLP-dependent aminotransferase family protein [Blastocatellia bacterium]